MAEKKEAVGRTADAADKAASDKIDASTARKKRSRGKDPVSGDKQEGGARVHHRYHDRTEDTCAVTHDDLREVRELGTVHQTLFGLGIFFFSGAFWQLIDTLSEQEKYEFNAWIGMYLISMGAGGILAAVGVYIFHSKQRRLDKYFTNDGCA